MQISKGDSCSATTFKDKLQPTSKPPKPSHYLSCHCYVQSFILILGKSEYLNIHKPVLNDQYTDNACQCRALTHAKEQYDSCCNVWLCVHSSEGKKQEIHNQHSISFSTNCQPGASLFYLYYSHKCLPPHCCTVHFIEQLTSATVQSQFSRISVPGKRSQTPRPSLDVHPKP